MRIHAGWDRHVGRDKLRNLAWIGQRPEQHAGIAARPAMINQVRVAKDRVTAAKARDLRTMTLPMRRAAHYVVGTGPPQVDGLPILRNHLYDPSIAAQPRVVYRVPSSAGLQGIRTLRQGSGLRIHLLDAIHRGLSHLLPRCCADVDVIALEQHRVGIVDLGRGDRYSTARIQPDVSLRRRQCLPIAGRLMSLQRHLYVVITGRQGARRAG